jgi:hypothetical protein
MTYAETISQLTQKLESLPLDSAEYQIVKKQIQEADFAVDFRSEFGEASTESEE